MNKSFYRTYFETEENHWWFKVRRNIILSLLKQNSIGKSAKIFDFGCGSGFNVGFLQNLGFDAGGADISPEAIEFGKSKCIKNLILADENGKIDFPERSFDIVLALDVLEHIKDDSVAIKSIEKSLKSGGLAVITAPAYKWMWGAQDEASRHFRRYTSGGLSALVKNNTNFCFVKKTYFNTFLFPAIAGVRLWSKAFGLKERESDFDINNKFLNGIFYFIFNLESKFLNFINFPFGVSILLVLKKRG